MSRRYCIVVVIHDSGPYTLFTLSSTVIAVLFEVEITDITFSSGHLSVSYSKSLGQLWIFVLIITYCKYELP